MLSIRTAANDARTDAPSSSTKVALSPRDRFKSGQRSGGETAARATAGVDSGGGGGVAAGHSEEAGAGAAKEREPSEEELLAIVEAAEAKNRNTRTRRGRIMDTAACRHRVDGDGGSRLE